jgi:signal peptidase
MIRKLGAFAAAIAIAAVGTLMLTIVVALALGERPVTVLSGSMEPAIDTGDLLIERPISPQEARVGDIVTYKEPGTDTQITHRVRRVSANGAFYLFATKGDANNTVQTWEIAADGRLQQPLMRIPRLGYVAHFARTPPGLLLLVILPLLAFGGYELHKTWRPRRELSI